VFLLSLFLIIVLGKGIGKSIKWVGLGGIDKLFGFIFGGVTGYLYCVIILSLSNYIYIYDKWPTSLKNGSSYNAIEFGRKIFDEKILFSNEYLDETKDKLKK
jgi:membrane protein required for colicin V production